MSSFQQETKVTSSSSSSDEVEDPATTSLLQKIDDLTKKLVEKELVIERLRRANLSSSSGTSSSSYSSSSQHHIHVSPKGADKAMRDKITSWCKRAGITVPSVPSMSNSSPSQESNDSDFFTSAKLHSNPIVIDSSVGLDQPIFSPDSTGSNSDDAATLLSGTTTDTPSERSQVKSAAIEEVSAVSNDIDINGDKNSDKINENNTNNNDQTSLLDDDDDEGQDLIKEHIDPEDVPVQESEFNHLVMVILGDLADLRTELSLSADPDKMMESFNSRSSSTRRSVTSLS